MNLLQLFKPVKVFVFDIDGVLTDGQILVFETGEQVRRMSVKDGYALQLAVKKKYPVIVVSGGNGLGAKNRLLKLGIENVFLQVSDKKKQIEEYLRLHGFQWSEVLYMGDDIPDIEVMRAAGLACAPSDGAPEVLQAAKYISAFPGGGGCVRDVIEKVLRLHGTWDIDPTIASR
ncbi:MAG TPA: HAD hydrolase family protein [Puia sp.]|nr:HAD hydrolase family protein [Puia sp.]